MQPLRPLFLLLACAGLVASVTGQCQTAWLPGEGLRGAYGNIKDLDWWDPDGVGPAPAVVVVAGPYAIVDRVVHRIGTFDPVTGAVEPIGSGGVHTDDQILDVLPMPNGDLYVAGEFTSIGGVAANGVARWDGATWQPLGAGIDGVVRSIAALANGDIAAAGLFTTAGGVTVNGVARWDGMSWSALGSGVDAGVLSAVVGMPNGDVVVTGTMTMVGGVAVANIARWDGASWSSLGTGLSAGGRALLVVPNGDLVVGGTFMSAGGRASRFVARWNGGSWEPMVTVGVDTNYVNALALASNGDVLAVGTKLSRWNGAAWTIEADPNLLIDAVVETTTPRYLLGGSLDLIFWSGSDWEPLNPNGPLVNVGDMTFAPNGDVVLVGSMRFSPATSSDSVVRLTSAGPVAVGSLPSGPSSIDVMNNGDFVIGGNMFYPLPTGGYGYGVAYWDGVDWRALGGGVGTQAVHDVQVVRVLPDGDVLVGGGFWSVTGTGIQHLARWDGVSWHEFGSPDSMVRGLEVLPNGEVLVFGDFLTIGGIAAAGVARWDGATWSGFANTTWARTYTGIQLSNGDLVVGGKFDSIGGVAAKNVARWDGTQWHAMGLGLDHWAGQDRVLALLELPNGDVMAGGVWSVADGQPGNGLARWNGSTWVSDGAQAALAVTDMLFTPEGQLLISGSRVLVVGDETVSVGLAYLASDCTGESLAYGSGCVGSGGLNELATDERPWLGGTFEAMSTGMPPTGLALSVFGFSPVAVPLAVALPSPASCELLATPDVLDLLVYSGDMVSTSAAIPSTPSIAGTTLYHQVVALELSASLDIIEFTSTNALELTVGSF